MTNLEKGLSVFLILLILFWWFIGRKKTDGTSATIADIPLVGKFVAPVIAPICPPCRTYHAVTYNTARSAMTNRQTLYMPD